MKIQRSRLAFVIAGLVIVSALLWLRRANNLGLSGFDILMGGRPDVEALRDGTKAVAEEFLYQRQKDLIGESGEQRGLVLDYSKSSEIRSLGYRSSFYYYCWDIYLPFSIHPDSNAGSTVVVQLTNSTPDQSHDPGKFRVLRAVSLDGQGNVIKQIENHEKDAAK